MSFDPPTSLTRRELVRVGLWGGSVAAVGGLSACNWLEQALRVAAHVWVGYEPLFLAENRRWLDPQRVQLLPTNNSVETVAALADGRAQAGALTLDEVLRARAGGLPLSVVLVFNVSLGADMLLARPGVVSLDQLKGLRLGYEAGSVGEIMLAEALRLGGLSRQDVRLTVLPVDQQVLAWQAGQVDAVISYEPVASQLLDLGMQRLFDSRQIPNTVIDVLAVHRDALNWRHAAALRHLLDAHFRALDEFERNPQDAAYRMAPHLNLPPSAVVAAFKGLLLPTVANNHQLLGGDAPLLARARQVSQILQRVGLILGQDPLTDLIDPAYLPTEGLLK
ncbi:ABC transporter substrate-binding protein [Rhodoferax sp. 4810]|nr:ABC transporter substrate-binding protein [Rhodoferax jenense]